MHANPPFLKETTHFCQTWRAVMEAQCAVSFSRRSRRTRVAVHVAAPDVLHSHYSTLGDGRSLHGFSPPPLSGTFERPLAIQKADFWAVPKLRPNARNCAERMAAGSASISANLSYIESGGFVQWCAVDGSTVITQYAFPLGRILLRVWHASARARVPSLLVTLVTSELDRVRVLCGCVIFRKY